MVPTIQSYFMIKDLRHSFVMWIERHWVEFFSVGALLLLLLFVLWPLIIYTIPSGHVGVMWYRFFGGTVIEADAELEEGLHIIFPWDKIFIYNVRLQSLSVDVNGLSVDGLEIDMKITSRFVVDRRYAGYLHKSLGPDFQETLMRPQLRNLVLTYISEHEAADLYSVQRAHLQSLVTTRFQAALANISTNVAFDDSYIRLEDVLIDEIALPAFVRSAIQQKERVRHMSEAYEFRLRLEERERQRKRIEAEGIRSFQEIVAPGITDSYLRWRGIEATLQLAQSNNAKVIVIGGGGDGLPIILNAEGTKGDLIQPQGNGLSDTGDEKKSSPNEGDPLKKSQQILDDNNGIPLTADELLHSPSLAGPAPLTASGAALLQEMMNPPGLSTDDSGFYPEQQKQQKTKSQTASAAESTTLDEADKNPFTQTLDWLDRIVNWQYPP